MRRIIIGLACLMAVGTANAAPRHTNRPIIIHQHQQREIAPYVMIGVMAGIVIYHITRTPCQSGVICTRF